MKNPLVGTVAILSRRSPDEMLRFPVKSMAVRTGRPSNGVEGVAQAQSASSKEVRILRKAKRSLPQPFALRKASWRDSLTAAAQDRCRSNRCRFCFSHARARS